MSPKQWGKMRFEGSSLSEADVDVGEKGEAKGDTTKSKDSTKDSNTPRPSADLDPRWTTHQSHLHLLTSLLPHLLRTPERDIRIISLISPGYAAALPSLQSLNSTMTISSPLIQSGIRGLTSLLMMARFGLILDTLASAIPKEKPVPSIPVDAEAVVDKKEKGKREVDVRSNIKVINVVMPWCRGDVLRGIWGADESWLRWIL